MAVNLRDCSPFASTHKTGLTEAELATWEAAFNAGIERAAAGDNEQAIERFLAAAGIDDRHAELQFRLAECLLAEGRENRAREAFLAARDLDALRFRADSRINGVIRQVAGEHADVHLADAERAVSESARSVAGLPGEELFFEHVHMAFDGNYEVARAMFPVVIDVLPEDIRARGPASPTPPSRERCAELLDLTAWREAQMFSYMLQLIERPPFVGQFDHTQRHAALTEKVRQLEALANESNGDGEK